MSIPAGIFCFTCCSCAGKSSVLLSLMILARRACRLRVFRQLYIGFYKESRFCTAIRYSGIAVYFCLDSNIIRQNAVVMLIALAGIINAQVCRMKKA